MSRPGSQEGMEHRQPVLHVGGIRSVFGGFEWTRDHKRDVEHRQYGLPRFSAPMFTFMLEADSAKHRRAVQALEELLKRNGGAFAQGARAVFPLTMPEFADLVVAGPFLASLTYPAPEAPKLRIEPDRKARKRGKGEV